MSDEPQRLGSRLLDLCVTVLLAAMALWGAVAILQSIWVWLCVGVGVAACVALPVWIAIRRRSRW